MPFSHRVLHIIRLFGYGHRGQILGETYSMYGVSLTSLRPPLEFFHYDFDCLNIWAQIPSGPDNFKGVIKYQTFRTSFHGGFFTKSIIQFIVR